MSDYSRSIRAEIAEDEGCLPASRITRAWLDAAGVSESVGFVRWLCGQDGITASQWHHTGSKFRRTDYYSADDIAAGIDNLAHTGDLEDLRRQWKDHTGRSRQDRPSADGPASDDQKAAVAQVFARKLNKTVRTRIRTAIGNDIWRALVNPTRRQAAIETLTDGQARRIINAGRR